METTLTPFISHRFLKTASIMSAYGMKGSFSWQLGDDCANVRDRLPGLDVATSRVDVQTAVGLLDALSPINA